MIIYGFRYIGNGSPREREGVCVSCGRRGRLVSRTARWWFTLYFIPVIPGTRHRLFDMCPSCNNGSMLSFSEYERRALAVTRPLLERFRAGDPAAGIERARALIDMARYGEARRQAQEVAALGGPSSAEAEALLEEAARFESGEEGRVAAARRTFGFVLFAVVATVVLLVARAAMTVRVVVDNPGARPLALTLDGDPWVTLPPGVHHETSLGRGVYAVTATAGGVSESFALDVDPGFGPALHDAPAYFVDPLRLGVYEEYDATYGATSPRRENSIHVAERCFRADDVDDALRDPPTQQPDRTRRHVVQRMSEAGSPGEIAAWLMNHDRGAEAAAYIERAVDAGGVAPTAADLNTLVQIAAYEGRGAEASAWMAARRTDLPAGMPFHVAAQEAAIEDERRDEVREEYARLLDAHPSSADHLYLAGRVATSCAEALPLFERAIMCAPGRLDLVHARVEALSLSGREDEAVRVAQDAAERGVGNDREGAREMLIEACARAGQHERARGLMQQKPVKEGQAAGKAFMIARLTLRTAAPGVAWDRALQEVASGPNANAGFALRLRVEHARQALDAGTMVAAAEALGKRGGGDPGFVSGTLVLAEAARGDAGAAENRLAAFWEASSPELKPRRAALRYAILAAWTGAGARAEAWRQRVLGDLDGTHGPVVARSVAAYLAAPAPAATPVTGEEFILDDDARGLLLLARALRTRDARERDRLLERAERAQGTDCTESAAWARLLRTKGAPAGM